jgi:hypothetical protein
MSVIASVTDDQFEDDSTGWLIDISIPALLTDDEPEVDCLPLTILTPCNKSDSLII